MRLHFADRMLYRLPATNMTEQDLHCPNCGQANDQGIGSCTACGAELPLQSGDDQTRESSQPEALWTVGQITVALFLFLGLVFASALIARAVGLLYEPQESALQAWVAVHLLAISAGATVWLMGVRGAAAPLRALGLVRFRTSAQVSVFLALSALGFSIMTNFGYGYVVDRLGLEVLKPPDIDPDIIFPGLGVLLSLQALAVVTPLSEEVLFRGFVLRGLLRSVGPGPAVVSTALVFSVFHLNVGTVLPIFLTGLALGFLYLRTGSLWPCIAAHAGQNAIAVLAVRAGL